MIMEQIQEVLNELNDNSLNEVIGYCNDLLSARELDKLRVEEELNHPSK